MIDEAKELEPTEGSAKFPEDAGQHRRDFVGRSSSAILSAAVIAKAAGAQDIEKAMKAKHDKSESDAGPENEPLKGREPEHVHAACDRSRRGADILELVLDSSSAHSGGWLVEASDGGRFPNLERHSRCEYEVDGRRRS